MIQKLNYAELLHSGFLKLPELLYPKEEIRMVPNDISEADFIQAFYIPDKGRVVLFHHPSTHYLGEGYMTLGFFECVDSTEIAILLFEAAQEYALEAGIKWLIGPMNGNTWSSYRFMTTKAQPLFFTEYRHHHYYLKLWEASRFQTLANYYSSIDTRMDLADADKDDALEMNFKKEGIIIRSLNMALFDEEMVLICEFCNKFFSGNFLFSTIGPDLFLAKYKPIKPFIDPGFVKIAEDSDRRIIALFFAIPDIYNLGKPTLIVKTIVRNPSRKYAGIIHLMGNIIVKEARNKGYLQMIHAFMHSSNSSNNVSKKFSGELFREYVLLGKKINEIK